MEKFEEFTGIAEVEYSSIVVSSQDLGNKLRIYLKDKSFIDFYYAAKVKPHKFSIHWERGHIDGSMYRLDNTPDRKWSKVSTFPTHFHNKVYAQVKSPPFNVGNKEVLESLFRKFLDFVKGNI